MIGWVGLITTKLKKGQALWLMTVIPAIKEAGIKRIMLWGHLRQKNYWEPVLTNKLGVVVCTCHPRYVGDLNRRISVQVSPGQKHVTLSEKN
jgi:hypothetical protein